MFIYTWKDVVLAIIVGLVAIVMFLGWLQEKFGTKKGSK